MRTSRHQPGPGPARSPSAAARELQQPGCAERIATIDAEAAGPSARPRELLVTSPAAAAHPEARHTARVEADWRAWAEVVAKAYPATGTEAARYGAAAQATAEAEAEPPTPERTRCLENMPENRAGIEASWQHDEAERPAAAAAPEPDASLDAPEIGDVEPELGL
jgi:hypothetical protein